jgi:hypothetical protein
MEDSCENQRQGVLLILIRLYKKLEDLGTTRGSLQNEAEPAIRTQLEEKVPMLDLIVDLADGVVELNRMLRVSYPEVEKC